MGVCHGKWTSLECEGVWRGQGSPALVVRWGWLVGRGPAPYSCFQGSSIVLDNICVSLTCGRNGTWNRCSGTVSLADSCLTLMVLRLLELQKSVSMLNWL